MVLDALSRRLLGYQMSDRIDTRLVQDALDMACDTRGGHTAGIVFHSDHGSQASTPCLLYTSPSPRDGLLSRMPSSA